MAEKEIEKYNKILFLYNPYINKNNVIASLMITKLKISGIFTDDFDEVCQALTSPPDKKLYLNQDVLINIFKIYDSIETYTSEKISENSSKSIILETLGISQESVEKLQPDLILKLSLAYEGPVLNYKIEISETEDEIKEKIELYKKLYPLDKHLIYNPKELLIEQKNYSIIHITPENPINDYGFLLLMKKLKYNYNITKVDIIFHIILGKNSDDYIKLSEKLSSKFNYFEEINKKAKKYGIKNGEYVIE